MDRQQSWETLKASGSPGCSQLAGGAAHRDSGRSRGPTAGWPFALGELCRMGSAAQSRWACGAWRCQTTKVRWRLCPRCWPGPCRPDLPGAPVESDAEVGPRTRGRGLGSVVVSQSRGAGIRGALLLFQLAWPSSAYVLGFRRGKDPYGVAGSSVSGWFRIFQIFVFFFFAII